jgi:hypothetical protein
MGIGKSTYALKSAVSKPFVHLAATIALEGGTVTFRPFFSVKQHLGSPAKIAYRESHSEEFLSGTGKAAGGNDARLLPQGGMDVSRDNFQN